MKIWFYLECQVNNNEISSACLSLFPLLECFPHLHPFLISSFDLLSFFHSIFFLSFFLSFYNSILSVYVHFKPKTPISFPPNITPLSLPDPHSLPPWGSIHSSSLSALSRSTRGQVPKRPNKHSRWVNCCPLLSITPPFLITGCCQICPHIKTEGSDKR